MELAAYKLGDAVPLSGTRSLVSPRVSLGGVLRYGGQFTGTNHLLG